MVKSPLRGFKLRSAHGRDALRRVRTFQTGATEGNGRNATGGTQFIASEATCRRQRSQQVATLPFLAGLRPRQARSSRRSVNIHGFAKIREGRACRGRGSARTSDGWDNNSETPDPIRSEQIKRQICEGETRPHLWMEHGQGMAEVREADFTADTLV